jgi:hypothetical protein
VTTKISKAEAIAADDTLRQLDIYGVTVNQDWGYRRYLLSALSIWPRYTPEPDADGSTWHDGVVWSIPELESVDSAVRHIASDLGGMDKFKKAMGKTRIVKTTMTGKFLIFLFSGGRCISPGLITLYNDISNLASEVQQSIVIHEFGHIWDWTTLGRLSCGLSRCVKAHAKSTGQSPERPPGVTDPDGKRYAEKWPFEDWAVSFHAYIQPEHWAFQPPHSGLGPVRQSFVQQQVDQLQQMVQGG